MKTILQETTIQILDVYKLHKYYSCDAKNMPNKKGVYFLFDYFLEDDSYKLIYIGQTKELNRRLWKHLYANNEHSNHAFSYFAFIEIENLCLRELSEIAYICYYLPEFNRESKE